MKQCQKCGNTVEDSVAFCTNCGEPLSSAVASASVGVAGAPNVGEPMGQPVGQPVEQLMGQSMEQLVGQPMGQPANVGVEGLAGAMNQPIAVESPMNQQPGVASGAQQSTIDDSEKKAKKKIAVLTAVSVVCFVIGVIGIVLAIVGFSQKGSSGPVAAGGSEGGGSVIDVTNDGTKVFLSGFEFVMPKGYDYEVREEDGMEILGYSDNSGYFAMTNYRNDISFSAVKNRMNLLADEYSKAYGRTVVGNKRTVDDVEMVYFDLGVVEDVNVVFVYSDADLRTFETAILTDIGVDGTQYFNNVAKILKTAKKKTEMNKSINGAGFEDVNLPRITVEIEE